jgi:hypothetical protein
MTRAVYRFRNWHVTPDPTATEVYTGACVTDEEACQWTSGERAASDDVTALIAKHANETEHHCFKRATIAYATANPGEWL